MERRVAARETYEWRGESGTFVPLVDVDALPDGFSSNLITV